MRTPGLKKTIAAPPLAALAAALLGLPLAGQQLRITETAGIRRFSFPVTASLPPQLAGRPVRLLRDGKPVQAQVRGGEIDFNVSLGPYEHQEFSVVPQETPAPEAAASTVDRESDQFTVAYGESLHYIVPLNLLGLLRAVKTPRWDYLRPGSQGLLLRFRDDIIYRAGGFGPYGKATSASVVKQGPLDSVIEFSSTEALRGNYSVPSKVRMEFPRSKSWVKTTWTVEDPNGLLTGLGADLNLNLTSPPALVDFGAGTLVYTQLRPGQTAVLIGQPQSWQVLVGNEPYVTAKSGRAEGWAHVMDRERCTVVAVKDFGEREDRIEVASDGRLQIWRSFRGSGEKAVTFWLHFVRMPVEIGAATSPQSILAPLKIDWIWTNKN